MTDSYSYTRFRWVDAADLGELNKRLTEAGLDVKVREMPTSEHDLSPYRRHRTSLFVKADTLGAIIAAFRATLSQRDKQPFTAKDMRLREIVLEEYPRNSSSFFPWGFNMEPPFTVAE